MIWRPFFLDPNLPGGEGHDKRAHYNKKFGADRVAQMEPMMAQTFADSGIPAYQLDGRVANTMDSHRLLEHALRSGGPAVQDALCESLFRRYFCEGKSLAQRDVLLAAAAEANVDGAAALLDGDDLSEEVMEEVERAVDDGVGGVPFFRIDGGEDARYSLSGAQPSEAFVSIFSEIAAK